MDAAAGTSKMTAMEKIHDRRASQVIPPELLHAIREIIRRAVMALAAVRDPDARYMGLSRLPATIVRDVNQAYGYVSASVRNFQPSSYELEQMEIVLPWLAWIRREEGEQACRRILAWAMGSQLWRIGQRENCSERTALNRIDRSICAIVEKFVGIGVTVEKIEEPYKGTPYALLFEKPAGPHGGEVIIKRVYIGGVGFMKGGKRLRRGDENLSDQMLA